MNASNGAALETWLLREAMTIGDLGDIVEAFAERLNAAGLDVGRAISMVQTLHPRYVAVTRLWQRGEGVVERRPLYNPDGVADYQRSPLFHVRESKQLLNARLDRGEYHGIPMLAELAEEGITHYLLAPLFFSDGMINGFSIATRRPGGFPDGGVELFRSLLPALTTVVEIKGLRRMLPEILTAYVGADPARRILAGAIHRGEVQEVEAAMMSCDLRGFTTVSDRVAPPQVIDWLNRYFDAVVPAVEAEAGEILKFMGDGVFSAFAVDGHQGEACRRALRAACATVAALAEAPPEPAPYRTAVALHVGTVGYGNIGAGDRLDFTVIGSDVNLVNRLEILAKQLDRPLIMSEPFAACLDLPVERLGSFDVPGFRAAVAAYCLTDVDVAAV